MRRIAEHVRIGRYGEGLSPKEGMLQKLIQSVISDAYSERWTMGDLFYIIKVFAIIVLFIVIMGYIEMRFCKYQRPQRRKK